MSTEQIHCWINHEVKLSKYVINFEREFANGCLFGELLTKHKLLDLHHFCNSDYINDKLNNFRMLEPVFKALKIDFNPKIVNLLMKQEKGVAQQVLYQIKLAIEDLDKKTHASSNSKGRLETTGNLLKPTSPRNQKFAKTISNMFSHRSNNFTRTPKEISMDNRLTKFVEFRVKSQEKAETQAIREWEKQLKLRNERRRKDIKALHKHMYLRETMEEKGWAEWEKAQQKRKALEQEEREFYIKTEKKNQEKAMSMLNKERSETYDALSFMEDNLRKLRASMGQGDTTSLTGTNVTDGSKKERMKFW